MAAPVLPLQQEKLPTIPSTRPTSEQLYWRSFKSPLLIPSPSNNPINHISQPSIPSSSSAFPSAVGSLPDLFTVATGARVQVYSIRTRKLLKTFSRFEDTARGVDVRPDGRTLVAGDDTGTIQVFDTNSRSILRTWKGSVHGAGGGGAGKEQQQQQYHKQPVWVTKFSPSDPTTLLSASDDTTARLWDLTSETPIRTFIGHTDYARSGLFMPGTQSANLVLTGSYDRTVRLWDTRAQGRSVLTFKMNAPIESVLSLPSATTVLASADNKIAVLDIVAGRPLHMIKSHQKTVTSLCLASRGSRVVSGALDGHMKVFETTGWNPVAGAKYPSPILSLGVVHSTTAEREDKHIAVGMQSGLLSIRTRLSGEQKIKEKTREREMQALLAGRIEEHDRKFAKKNRHAIAEKRGHGWEKRFRGMDFIGENVDIVIDAATGAGTSGNANGTSKKRKREAPWELDLRKGRYAAALDGALAMGNKIVILTILTALRHRAAMRAALMNRDEVTLQPILKWIYKSITDPRLANICVEVGMHIMEVYGQEMGSSGVIDGLVEKLRRRVDEEVERSQQAFTTKGMLELLKSQ